MRFGLLLCTVSSTLVISTYAAPMGNQRTSSKSHSPHRASDAGRRDASNSGLKPELAPASPPYPSEVTDIFKTRKVWASDKEQLAYTLKANKIMLGEAAVATTKPDPRFSDVELHQNQLKKVHGRMKGWHTYFTSEEGKQKADTEGRRAVSAQRKMVTTEKWHDLADILKPKEDSLKMNSRSNRRKWREVVKSVDSDKETKEWQETAASIPGRIDEIEKEYRQASDAKRAKYRHRYGLFQIHVVHDRADPNDIPFESSQEAHQRLKKEREQRKQELTREQKRREQEQREQEQRELRKRKRTPV